MVAVELNPAPIPLIICDPKDRARKNCLSYTLFKYARDECYKISKSMLDKIILSRLT
jgi:hypothetical protein